MLSSWEQKDHDGATRLACMACGAHTLVTDPQALSVCNCCGSVDLRSVAVAEAGRHGSRARRHAARGIVRRGAIRVR